MLLAAPAVRVVGPATVSGPLSVMAPLVVTLSAADGGGAQIQGIHIVEDDGIAAHHTDRTEVVGVIEVMLLAAPAVRVVGPAT